MGIQMSVLEANILFLIITLSIAYDNHPTHQDSEHLLSGLAHNVFHL